MAEAQPLRPQDPGRLGAYELVGRLGSGGRGTVFLGSGPGGERVAVRLLPARLGDETARARFLREAAAARQVARFCTAQLLDADLAGDTPYLVSEYVPGPSLGRRVAEEGPVSGGALERLAVNTASALAAVHRAGIVHLDLGPRNVLLGPDGPRVIDFGLPGAPDAAGPGGPAHPAPEQVAGRDAGPPADVFAWGAMMTFAATGRSPFGGGPAETVADRVLHHDPDLGGLDGELREVIAAALAKDPADRPTAAQVLMRLVGQDDTVAAPLQAEAAADPLPLPGSPSGAGGREHADVTDGTPAAGGRAVPGGTGGTAGGAQETAGGRSTRRGPGPARPGGRSRRGRRRRPPSRAPALLTAAAIALTAGAAAYTAMTWTTGQYGRGATVANPSPDAPPGTAATPGGTRPALTDPADSPAPEEVPYGGTRPAGPRPSTTAAPVSGENGTRDGDDGEPLDAPSSAPPVLGSPDPQRYCETGGELRAAFRSGEWYCRPEDGSGAQDRITMTQVCRWQYVPDAEARLDGAAGTPSDWECLVPR